MGFPSYFNIMNWSSERVIKTCKVGGYLLRLPSREIAAAPSLSLPPLPRLCALCTMIAVSIYAELHPDATHVDVILTVTI